MIEHMDPDPLTEQLERLPAECHPERDLWPGIEARLESRQSLVSGDETERRLHRRWGAREWGLQSLAALLFMVLGSLITWLSVGQSTGMSTGLSGGPDPRVAVRPQTAGSVETVSFTGQDSFTGQEGHPLDVVEANYLRARDALWMQAVENREALPPGTLKVVEKNLEILERAISDLRQALALDPGNPNLERRLLDSHQRSIDLLRRVVREV